MEKRDPYDGSVIEPRPGNVARMGGSGSDGMETDAEFRERIKATVGTKRPTERALKVELSSVEDLAEATSPDARFQAELQGLGDLPMIATAESPGLALQSLGAQLDVVLAGRQWDGLVAKKTEEEPSAGHVLLVVEPEERAEVDHVVARILEVTARAPRMILLTRACDPVPVGVFFRYAIRTRRADHLTEACHVWEQELLMRIARPAHAAHAAAAYLLVENAAQAAKLALEEALR